MAEKILLNYEHQIEYQNTQLNIVGATTSTTLRTLDTVSGDTAYVRKFGTDYSITDVTDIEDPIDANMTFKVYALDGTLLGSRTGGGAFVDGSTVTAQGCYLEIEASGGAVTVLASITIDTDVDAGGLAFTCATETVSDGDTLRLYLSDTGSTYYDSLMKYGGARHTPVLGNLRKPYFDIGTAYAALNSANDGVEVLDSEIYDEELTFDRATTFVQASLGQTPTITAGIGTRVTREVSTQYNNTTAVYFNINGDDGTGDGTYQNPYETPAFAITNRGGKHVVFGGINCVNATYETTGLTISGSHDFECDYGYICTLELTASSYCITITATSNVNIYGFNLDGQNIGGGIIHNIGANISDMNIKDNTIYNIYGGNNYHGIAFVDGTFGFTMDTIDIARNDINRGDANIIISGGKIISTIEKNLLYDCYDYDINATVFLAASNVIISKNICYGTEVDVGFNDTGILIFNNINNPNITVEYNTIYKKYNDGIRLDTTIGANTYIVRKNICRLCTRYGIQNTSGVNSLTVTYIDFYENTNDISANIIAGAGVIYVDPDQVDVSNNNFSLMPASPCKNTDGSEFDIGYFWNNIIIAQDDITINGFIMNGYNSRYNTIAKIGATDYTGLTLKFLTIYNYNNQAIDDYSGSNTDTIIENCSFHDNSNGIRFYAGNNSIEESLIYNHTEIGIYVNGITQTFNHCVFHFNKYGLYFTNQIGLITFKNNITNINSLYGIYSELAITITYCCITDAIFNVDITSETNTIDNPLFLNTNIGTENFNIKTVEDGFTYNSPCKNNADDGYDIGAYLVTRLVNNDWWKKYNFDFNPQVTWANQLKGYVRFDNALGNRDNFAKDSKRIFSFDFGKRSQVSNETLRQKMEYFATLIKTRVNEFNEERIKFRLHLQPDSFLSTGSGVVDSTAKTITSTITLSLIENQFKGFHIGIKWESGTNMVIDDVAKTGTVGGAAWTVDEWIGYYAYINGYYYYIKSNTAASLTFSDPDDTLVSGLVDWNIEKYFKITANTIEGVFTVTDDNDELPDGTYNYYIDFIEVKIYQPKFDYSQPIFDYTREHSKSGYKIIFEEL